MLSSVFEHGGFTCGHGPKLVLVFESVFELQGRIVDRYDQCVSVFGSGGVAVSDLLDRLTRRSGVHAQEDRKSTRLNSSHVAISYAVFCLKKKKPAKSRSVLTN